MDGPDKHHSEVQKKDTKVSMLYNSFYKKCAEFINHGLVNRLKVAMGYRGGETEMTVSRHCFMGTDETVQKINHCSGCQA